MNNEKYKTIHRELDDDTGRTVLKERYTEEGAKLGWGEVGDVQNYLDEPEFWHRAGQQMRELAAHKIFITHQLLNGNSQTFIRFLAHYCPFHLFGDFHEGFDELTVELYENQPDGNNNGFEFSAEKKYLDDGRTNHQFLFKLFIPKNLVRKILASLKVRQLETLTVTLDLSDIPGVYENATDPSSWKLKFLCAETKVQGLQSKNKTDVFDSESEKSFFPGQIMSVNAVEHQYSPKHKSVEILLAEIQYELQNLNQRPR